MIRAIFLDCGAVLVAPVTGDWMLPLGFEDVLGEDFMDRHLDSFRQVRTGYVHLLPDANRVDTDEAECQMFIDYYQQVLNAMGTPITREQAEQLARLQAYGNDRYQLFDDVLPSLARWRGKYMLGIISDAPPSTRRIMDRAGVTDAMDRAVYSCELGVLKPHPDIYRYALDQLGVAPEEAVFVDDMPGNLYGAEALGIRGIQMCREMPPRFSPAPRWDGPVVHNLAELDALLGSDGK